MQASQTMHGVRNEAGRWQADGGGWVCKQDELLRLHKTAGGELNVEEAACAWVRANAAMYAEMLLLIPSV